MAALKQLAQDAKAGRISEAAAEKFVIGTGTLDSSGRHSLLGNASLCDEIDRMESRSLIQQAIQSENPS